MRLEIPLSCIRLFGGFCTNERVFFEQLPLGGRRALIVIVIARCRHDRFS